MKLTAEQQDLVERALDASPLRERISRLIRVPPRGDYDKGWNDCILDVMNAQREEIERVVAAEGAVLADG